MAIRVDHQGYLIDSAGRRLREGNSLAEVTKRWNKIVEDWKKNHKGDNDGPDKGTTIMQVENGDCQWTMAVGAGADPVKTYQQLNDQFRNPHLIHRGDIVFIDQTTHLAVNRHGDDNVDLFRDQQQGRAEAGVSPAVLTQEAGRFFGSVPNDPEVKDQVLLNLFQSWPHQGDAPKATALNRQTMVEAYLRGFTDPAERLAKLQELRGRYDGNAPDEPTSVTWDDYNAAIDAAAKTLGLPARQSGAPATGDQTGTGQPGTGPTDISGKPITNDRQLTTIYNYAAASKGKSDDQMLRNAILEYVKLGEGSPEDVAKRVKTLFETNFGAHDYQVNDYILNHLTGEVGTKLRKRELGELRKDMEGFIRTYLNALPNDQTIRQRAVDKLLDHDLVRGDYGVTRKAVATVAEELGLKHNVFSIS